MKSSIGPRLEHTFYVIQLFGTLYIYMHHNKYFFPSICSIIHQAAQQYLGRQKDGQVQARELPHHRPVAAPP